METKANYVVVGIFTVLAVLAGFGFVYWSAGLGANGESVTLRVRIPGSAAGLGRGSLVLFNGVRVGDVRRVYIDVTNPNVAIADAEIDRLTPITPSTQADIGIASLTGQANIELRGGDPTEGNLLDEAEATDTIAEITANPSAVTSLLQSAQDIFTRADRVMVALEGFAEDVRSPLTETIENVNRFSEALGRNSEGVDEFLTNFTELSENLGAASGRLETTLSAAEDLLRAVDRDKVNTIVANVEQFTDQLSAATGNLDRIVANVDETVNSVRRLSDNASGTIGRVDGILDGIDPEQVRVAFGNFSELSGELRAVAGRLDTTLTAAEDVLRAVDEEKITAIVANAERFTDELSAATGNLDRIVANVDETVTSVRRLSDNASGTIGRVDGILEGIDPEQVRVAVGNFTEFSGELRGVADRLDTTLTAAEDVLRAVDEEKITTIMANVERFTGRLDAATGDLEGIMANVSQTAVSVRSFSEAAEGTIGRIDGILEGVDPETVKTALSNIEGASSDARKAAADVANFTDRVNFRADDVDRIITDAQDLMARLNRASMRVDGVLARADSILGSGEAEGVIQQASETLAAFRRVADTLGARVDTIAEGLARFSGQGLREAEALIRDARRSVTRIERAITDLERNPQRIITGGEGTVRQFDGRTRR
jgi:phospholipid/cholesterol/gamma-HCH transport system substrate-binding protein